MNDVSTERAIKALFTDIAAAFGALDLPRFRQLYALPCMIVTPQGGHPIHNDEEFSGFFLPMLHRLQAQGFGRSAFERMSVKLLAPTIALASMHWTRFRTDGTVLETLGATYTLLAIEGHWRIVSLIAHSADTVATIG